MPKYHLLTKPSFLKSLHSISANEVTKIFKAGEKIQRDPYLTGNKKLKGYKNFYRYRVGNFRIIYAISSNFVSFFKVEDRKQVYKDNSLIYLDKEAENEKELEVLTTHFDELPIETPKQENIEEVTLPTLPKDRRRTDHLLTDMLIACGVEKKYHDDIGKCSCIDEIIESKIPEPIIEKILDVLYPKTVKQLEEEPTYEVESINDFKDYREGKLSSFLLKLDPEQDNLARKEIKGPVLVKGKPGTGKSLVALYRIRNLFKLEEQGDVFGQYRPKVLFLTFTRSLIEASQQLLQSLLPSDIISKYVNVINIDKFARNCLVTFREEYGEKAATDRTIEYFLNLKITEADNKALIERAKEEILEERRKNAQLITNQFKTLPSFYLEEEFDWVIDGRSISEEQTYFKEDRRGRGIRFNRRMREISWQVYRRWVRLLQVSQKFTYTQVLRKALQVTQHFTDDHKYDAVIIDEAQDLKPVAIQLALSVCKSPQGIYLTADGAQSIYGRGFSWNRVSEDLNVRGRTTILKTNYRSTEAIQKVSNAFMQIREIADSEEKLKSIRSGPKPSLYGVSDADEVGVIKVFIEESSEQLRMASWNAAILVRDGKTGQKIALQLTAMGMKAQFVRSKHLELDAKYVKVMTIHAAKGLEFPIVCVASVNDDILPSMQRECQGAEDEEEHLKNEARLFNVALTRAMRRLLVTYSKENPSEFIKDLSKDLWTVL